MAKLARMKSDLAVGNWQSREKTLIELDGLLSAKAARLKGKAYGTAEIFGDHFVHFQLYAIIHAPCARARKKQIIN